MTTLACSTWKVSQYQRRALVNVQCVVVWHDQLSDAAADWHHCCHSHGVANVASFSSVQLAASAAHLLQAAPIRTWSTARCSHVPATTGTRRVGKVKCPLFFPPPSSLEWGTGFTSTFSSTLHFCYLVCLLYYPLYIVFFTNNQTDASHSRKKCMMHNF